MQPQIDLSGLRDVHLPSLPSLWPLPVDFWIAITGMISFVVLIRLAWIRYHRLTAKKYANEEVERLMKKFPQDDYRLATELSLLMRRIALMKYPREKVCALSGKTWREFLDKTTKKDFFKAEAGDIVEKIMFIPPEQFKNGHISELIEATKQWISENT